MVRINLCSGYRLQGKWSKNSYKIMHLLGEGGIGKVYKAVDIKTHKIWALKISNDLQSITKEYEMLKRFRHIGLVPKVKELDDFYYNNCKLYYIVMEYIEGKNIKEYIKDQPINEKASIGLAILIGKIFCILHKHNFVFGDLKLENLMIDQKNNVIKIIDLGGVTPIGSGIKEFTPLYDRASWDMGLRRADEGYDLFSLSMLTIVLLLKGECISKDMIVDKLLKKLKDIHMSSKLINLIHKGLLQRSITFEEFLMQLEDIHKRGLYKETRMFRVDKQNMVINIIFTSSILLFIGMMYKYVGKSNWF
ncbi:protein kinase [Crassaminicella thermophila]|uniref:Protein kinase n=1 Tax=Crassaminicella thermophila TaxID=2599308 RepID=A0A5C0SAB5_CRATE|nr:protein kinase [Crassaminicella thermophila]QEK11091.1 protein kinase [Crassaminicella thermophila]